MACIALRHTHTILSHVTIAWPYGDRAATKHCFACIAWVRLSAMQTNVQSKFPKKSWGCQVFMQTNMQTNAPQFVAHHEDFERLH
jgi:hypothetical protein